MVDIVSKAVRSRMMSGIRGKDTKPEMIVRKTVFAKGFRYRLHDERLPGKPDLVLPRHKAIIMVHGCFWHGHKCESFKMPKSNVTFWRTKILKNIANDLRYGIILKKMGWKILVVWECSIRGKRKLKPEIFFDRINSWIVESKRSSVLSGKVIRETKKRKIK